MVDAGPHYVSHCIIWFLFFPNFSDMRVVEDSVVCDLGTLAEVAVSTEQKTPNSEMTS